MANVPVPGGREEQLSRFLPVAGSLQVSEESGELIGGNRAQLLESEKPFPAVSCSDNHVGLDETFPGEHVNSDGQSLPGLAAELVRAQSSQTEQLTQREQSLERIKVHKQSPYIFVLV